MTILAAVFFCALDRPVRAGSYLELEVLTDTSGRLTFEQVSGPEFTERFQPSRATTLNFGFTNAAYWLRFRLPATLDPDKHYLLEVDFPLIDEVDLYVPKQPAQSAQAGHFTLFKAGELVPIGQRPVKYRNPVFPVTGEMLPPTMLYIRYRDCGSVPFSLKILEAAAFTEKLKDRHYGLGIYYGTMVIIIIYNLFIFLMVRIRSYLYYVVYVSCYVLWQMTYNGLAGEYLWPAFPWLTNQAVSFFICATGITALKFSRSFLRTAEIDPGLDRLLFWLAGCFGLVLALSLLPVPRVAIPLSALLAVLFAPSVLIVSLICWHRGFRPARYFAIAWFMLLCGTALLGLKSFGLLPSVFITEYGQQLGSVLEIALLSLALADMVNVLKQEKEAAQAEALRVQESAALLLEDKVRQRTRELELLSAKLAKYLAPQVYASIFSGKTEVRLSSYRRKLTVFFSDIKDFTRLTDSLEPEVMTGLINEYLNEMAEIIMAHGGTIDKFMGDAIMVFFGDPETRGEKGDARACLRMAIAMRERLVELRQGWQGLVALPFRVRMGINTGFCTVGNLGAENRLDYTIIGGAVNLASRLEKHAEPDQILISHNTHALIKEEVACEERGEIKVKGLAYPVATYQVIGLYENLPRDAGLFESQGKGYAFRLDLGRMDATARRRATSFLEKVLGLL